VDLDSTPHYAKKKYSFHALGVIIPEISRAIYEELKVEYCGKFY
jgi:hypothetical protein